MALLPAWMHGLTPELVKKAERELKETPSTRAECVKELRSLINDEDGFEPLMSEAFLLRFLRAKKFDVKRAHKTIKNYYAYKARYSGIITDFMPSELTDVLEMNSIFVSPKRCPNGGGILIVFVGSFDTDVATPEKLIATGIVSAEIGIETEASQVCGSQVIIDMRGMTWRKMRTYSNPILLSRLIRGLQDCWPYRINAIHGTHEPPYYQFVYSIIKPMLSKKLRERVHLHGDNMETLHKFLPPESLPTQLGGTLDEKDFLNFRSLIYENEHMMERINKYVFQGVKSPSHSNASSRATDEYPTLVIPRSLQQPT